MAWAKLVLDDDTDDWDGWCICVDHDDDMLMMDEDDCDGVNDDDNDDDGNVYNHDGWRPEPMTGFKL